MLKSIIVFFVKNLVCVVCGHGRNQHSLQGCTSCVCNIKSTDLEMFRED